MTVTLSSGLVVPEVYAGALRSQIDGRMVMANFSTRYTDLRGKPGDTLDLVSFARLADLAGDATEGANLTPEALTSATDASLVLAEAAHAVEISRRSQLTAFGSPVDWAIGEQARVIAGRIDSVLMAAAYVAAGATTSTGAALTGSDVDTALLAFGDRAIGGKETFSLLIHPVQFYALADDANFEAARDSQVAGFAGTYRGHVLVFVSSLVTVNAGPPATYEALMFANKPLALATKSDIEIKQQENVLARTLYVVSSQLYAAGSMIDSDIAGIETQ